MTVLLSASCTRATILSSELLPAPFTPMSPAFSPGATVNDTSSSTRRGPYERETLLTCNIVLKSFLLLYASVRKTLNLLPARTCQHEAAGAIVAGHVLVQRCDGRVVWRTLPRDSQQREDRCLAMRRTPDAVGEGRQGT